MPYGKVSDIPAQVRKHKGVLLTLAQANWVSRVADALEAEGKVKSPWAVAWTSFERSYRIEGKRWVRRKTAQEAGRMLIYVSDLKSFDVTFEKAEGGTLVKGLPLMRPGKYHGIQYDAEVFQGIVDNFATIKEEDAFVPALVPRHQYDHDGNIIPMDADEAQGFFENLTLDEEADTLCGDVLVKNADTIKAIKDGTLRYLSTEIDGDYQLAAKDQKKIGPALVGTAWVTYPASRGMLMNIVANAQDFPVYVHGLGLLSASQLQTELTRILSSRAAYKRDEDKGVYGPYIREVFEDRVVVEHNNEYWQHDYSTDGDKVSVKITRRAVRQDWVVMPAQAAGVNVRQAPLQALSTYLRRKGGTIMATLKARIQAAIASIAAGDDPAEDLEDLVKEIPEGEEPTGDQPDDPVQTTDDDGSVQAQLEQLQRSDQERQREMQVMETRHRQESVAVQVDALVTAGTVPPALRQHTFVVLDILMREDKKITILGEADDAGKRSEEEHDAKDVFIALLQSALAGVKTGPVGLVYEGEMVLPSGANEADDIKAGDDMAAIMRQQSGLKPEQTGTE